MPLNYTITPAVYTSLITQVNAPMKTPETKEAYSALSDEEIKELNDCLVEIRVLKMRAETLITNASVRFSRGF